MTDVDKTPPRSVETYVPREGSTVRVRDTPGRWSVWSRASTPGSWFVLPLDAEADAHAATLPDRWIEAHYRRLSRAS